LERAFRLFKEWLIDFYRAIKNDKTVELSDDMAAVFDRMLATEEQIEAAALESDFAPVFAGRTGGARNERKARSKEAVLARLMRDLTPENKSDERLRRESAEKIIREQVQNMAIYKAINELRTNPDMRLSDESILDVYGEGAFENLPAGVSSPEGRMSADDAALELGYGSGDELLQKMFEAPDIEDEIAARVDREMTEHRDSLDARIAAMADEEMGNDGALENLVDERDEISAAQMAAEEATPEEWDEIQAADEAAIAEAENPRSRPSVIRRIVELGGVNYQSVKKRYSKDALNDIRARGLPVGFWSKNGRGIDEIAQELGYLGIPVEDGEDLFNILNGDDPAVSPLEVARREGFYAAREHARAVLNPSSRRLYQR
jgi:hypothetical protein